MKSTDATVTMTALWQGLMLEAAQLKRTSSVFLNKNETCRTTAFIPTLLREWRGRVNHPWAEKHLMLMHLLRQDLDNWRKCTGVFWSVKKESLVLSSWHNELLRQINSSPLLLYVCFVFMTYLSVRAIAVYLCNQAPESTARFLWEATFDSLFVFLVHCIIFNFQPFKIKVSHPLVLFHF